MRHSHDAGAVARGGLLRILAASLALAVLTGCATSVQRQAQELRRAPGKPPTIVVMPLDVELAQLTAGGMQEPHAEWTEAAHKHMRAALEEVARRRTR